MADVIVMCGALSSPWNPDATTAKVPFSAIASGADVPGINFEASIPYNANATQVHAAIRAAVVFEYSGLGVVIANNDKVLILGSAVLA